MTSADRERLARTAYDAHRDALPASLPGWDDITEQEQQAWRAAVSAVTGPDDKTLSEAVPAQSIVIQTGGETRVFRSDFTAGRQGTLPVGDEHASSHHARFQYAHSFWYVEDLGSTNGTFLNGRRILAAQRLRKGDKIRIGRTTLTVIST